MLLVSFAALTARAQTAAVIDPQGHAFYSEGHEAPAFLDILAASFTISDTLTLTVDVAGSLPKPPGSGGLFVWHFALNTDDSTDPRGSRCLQGKRLRQSSAWTRSGMERRSADNSTIGGQH